MVPFYFLVCQLLLHTLSKKLILLKFCNILNMVMAMIIRNNYLNELIKMKDKMFIKVITGIRRCGKSILLQQFKDYLLKNGINEEQIIYINFEMMENEPYLNYKELYQHILDLTVKKKMYVFIDEIQEVKYFEKVIDSLFAKGNYDIYITGSNSHLLSSEISTLLSGRYVEIKMLPLSFKEYLELVKTEKKEAFNSYFKYGGLPYAAQIEDIDTKISYIEGIYNTIVIKDLIERKNISNVELLKDILKYVLDSIGNTLSSKKISDTLTSNGRKTSHVTVGNYLDALEESYILYRAERYDIRGKQRLKSLEKYYVADLGFRAFALGDRQYNVGFVLENIVYLELLRRGYKVNIGKLDSLEVDFIAYKDNEKTYYQVSASVLDPNTFEREIAPLKKINDNYKKVILTLDGLPMNYEGIQQVNIIDWLLEN